MKIRFCFLFLSFIGATGCGHQVHEGDWVTVKVALPGAPSFLPLGSPHLTSLPCALPVSRLIATSAKFGSFGKDMPASVDTSTVSSAGAGASVLSFDGNTSIALPASDDWVFHYVGTFDISSCSIGSSAYLSHGMTAPTSVMSEQVLVPMKVETFTGGAGVYLGPGALAAPAGSSLAKVQFSVSVPGTNCNGQYSVRLEDGSELFGAGVNLNFNTSPPAGIATPELSPVPKNMKMTLVIHQTAAPAGDYEFPFTTDNNDVQPITLNPVTGFCP